jgi:hypothetical protein
MFSHARRSIATGVSLLAAAGVALGIPSAAIADPAGPPLYRTLVAVGAGTTENVANGLSAVALDSNGDPSVFASYDATGGGQIQTRPGGAPFARPNGAPQGLLALSNSAQGLGLAGQVDIARSINGPTTSIPDDLAFVPFALDGMSWVSSATFGITNLPVGSLVGQDSDGDGICDLTLKNIFGLAGGSTTLETAAGVTRTVGSQGSGADIVPFVPPSGSGTWSLLRNIVGGSFSPRVSNTYTSSAGSQTVQENDGSVTAAVPNAIVPFSIPSYVAQGHSLPNVPDRRHGAALGSLNGVAPTVSGSLNPAFPIQRDLYFVAETDRLVNPTSTLGDRTLVTFLLGTGSGDTPWVCDLDTTIEAYGFLVPSDCGVIVGYSPFSA